MKFLRKSFRLTALVCAFVVLSGCAFGRKVTYSNTIADVGASGTASVALSVWDQRPYVVSGGKGATFVGLSRSGFGIPYNVNTASGQPLADDFAKSLSESLNARGFHTTVVPAHSSQSRHAVVDALHAAGKDRAVLVKLIEWKTDTYVHTKLIYDVNVIVLSMDGSESASQNFHNEAPVGNIDAAFRAAMEEWFSDPKIVAALK